MRHPLKAEKFFTKEEKERIRDATIKAESRTIGEIAVAVVDQSSRYHEAEVLGGIFLGGVISLVLTTFFFHGSVWSFIPLAFVFFFPSHLLFKAFPALNAIFTGRKRRELAVKERALRTFYEKGLYKTAASTGVLFFLSLLERKVWVLADRGIHSKIHQPTLNKFANLVSVGIQQGRAADALCEAINEMGNLLASHYPAGGEAHKDQLCDDVICGPGASETDGE
jgi:putative membrane protein